MRDLGMVGRAAIAVALASSMSVAAGGQFEPRALAGPLWWMPANSADYPRRHDRWWYSQVEGWRTEDGGVVGWEAATSFPYVYWLRHADGSREDIVWYHVVRGAPPNSACDVQNLGGNEGERKVHGNVGPPYPASGNSDADMFRWSDHGYSTAEWSEWRGRWLDRRAGWTPAAGGAAGLQVTLHVGEWWQGTLQRQAAPQWFPDAPSGMRSRDRRFGFFDVLLGTGRRPNPGWFDDGGNCLGTSMVRMHGVGDDDSGRSGHAFPRRGDMRVDGGDCWAEPRPLVLRANMEWRCEPALSERYDFSQRFWDELDARPQRPAPPWIGELYYPTGHAADDRGNFPPDYVEPYLLAQRGEGALYTVSELAEPEDAGETLVDVPWAAPPAPRGAAGRPAPFGGEMSTERWRAELESELLPPGARGGGLTDPFDRDAGRFGDGVARLPVQDSADPALRECVEMGEPGWTEAAGTFERDCPPPAGPSLVSVAAEVRSRSRGIVNRRAMGYERWAARERAPEVGPVHQGVGETGPGGRFELPESARMRRGEPLRGIGGAGFEWVEHGNATLACLFSEFRTVAGVTPGTVPLPVASVEAARTQIDVWLREMERQHARFLSAQIEYGNCGFFDDDCRAYWAAEMASAQAEGLRALRHRYTWEVIGDYRGPVLAEMRVALAGASRGGYGGHRPNNEWFAAGRWSGAGSANNRCMTAPPPPYDVRDPNPGTRYNENLIPSYWFAGAEDHSVPGGSGVAPMWYGRPTFEAQGAHLQGAGVDCAALMASPSPADHQAAAAADCYRQFANVAGRSTERASEQVDGLGLRYPPELFEPHSTQHAGPFTQVRGGTAVWRDFACPSVQGGYYAAGAEAVGTSHRSPWGRTGADPRIDLSGARRFSSGIPCTGNPDYDVPGCADHGAAPATGVDRRTVTGGYRTVPEFTLRYAGDPGPDLSVADVRVMESISAVLCDDGVGFGCGHGQRPTLQLDFGWDPLYFFGSTGYANLDLSPVGLVPRGVFAPGSYLIVTETWRGTRPGARGLGPIDEAMLQHGGPIRWYGAMVIGGTGGCALTVDGPEGRRADVQPGVLEPLQRIVCLLPADRPDAGACPGSGFGR